MTQLDPRPALPTSRRRAQLGEDVDDLDDGPDLDDDDGEWLGGLRAAGLPVRTTTTSPTTPSPGLRQLLDEGNASPGLVDLVLRSISDATRAAYERDWADFDTFCRIGGRGDPLDATALVVGEYVNDLVRTQMAESTIRRRLAAIGWAQQLATGHKVTDDPLITKAMAGAHRLLAGRGTKQAIPLRLGEARTIITALPIVDPNRPGMRRDQLLVALGWATALRASELVGLDVDDLTIIGNPDHGTGGLLVRVRTPKGGGAADWVAVPYASSWATCPVRKTIHWTRNMRTGALFRAVDRHGRIGKRLSARAVSDIVRETISTCLQTDPAGYSGHSLRAGFVTEARAHRVPDELIARHTRHTRPGHARGGMLNRYDRPAELLETHALDPSWW
jgi:site-specific recombinase XerD